MRSQETFLEIFLYLTFHELMVSIKLPPHNSCKIDSKETWLWTISANQIIKKSVCDTTKLLPLIQVSTKSSIMSETALLVTFS